MKEPVWLEREDCLAIHEMMLAQYGGLAGVRDENMLESALARPRNLFAYEKPSIAQMAAAYGVGIVQNHPFLDGNKRTGFVLAATFLELNGFRFAASEESVVQQVLALAAGESNESQFADWLEANSKKQRRNRS